MIVCCFVSLLAAGEAVAAQAKSDITIENECVKYVIGYDRQNRHFIDRRTGADYCTKSRLARVLKEGREYDASAVSFARGRLTVTCPRIRHHPRRPASRP